MLQNNLENPLESEVNRFKNYAPCNKSVEDGVRFCSTKSKMVITVTMKVNKGLFDAVDFSLSD